MRADSENPGARTRGEEGCLRRGMALFPNTRRSLPFSGLPLTTSVHGRGLAGSGVCGSANAYSFDER